MLARRNRLPGRTYVRACHEQRSAGADLGSDVVSETIAKECCANRGSEVVPAIGRLKKETVEEKI